MAELYTNAARIIEKVLKKQGCPKSLVLNNDNVKNKKKLYALVCETLKFKSVTEHIIEDTKLLSKEKQLKQPMALVLLYDFLFGKGLQLGGKLKQIITRNKTNLHASLAKMKVKAKVMRNKDLLPPNIRHQEENQVPRYVRVNTLKMSTDDVVSWFCDNGYQLGNISAKSSTQVTSQVSNSFAIDGHIPDILVFPSGTDFHAHPLYREGKIILQDKASCFPAFVLSPPAGSCVIDACAAPGNKTSHLAAIMENKGNIFAFDISSKRITTMEKLLHRAGEQITEVKNEDFLKVNPQEHTYKNVQYILVDPSCSGSGMVNRLDYVISGGRNMDIEEEQRITSLAQFQVKALSHALNFPAVKKVVYSTCSIHDKENEEVVKTVLERFHETFELSNALPTWPHRGHPIFPEAKNCVRASPQEGSTSGFFLALFTRKYTDNAKINDDTKLGMNRAKTKRNKKRKRNHSDTTMINDDLVKKHKKPELGETKIQAKSNIKVKNRKRKTNKNKKDVNDKR